MFKLWDQILAMVQKEKSPLGLPPNRALMEATDTFFRKPALVTKRSPHIRDATDLKRFMFMVVMALTPAIVWGIYNTGRSSYLAAGVADAAWRAYRDAKAPNKIQAALIGGARVLFPNAPASEIEEQIKVAISVVGVVVKQSKYQAKYPAHITVELKHDH